MPTYPFGPVASRRRLWILLGSMVAILGADLLIRRDFVLPFLLVPLLLGVAMLPYRQLLVQAGLALAFAGLSTVLRSASLNDVNWLRMLGMLVSAGLAIWISRLRDRAQLQRTETLRALQASETRYRLLAETSAAIVYTVDADRRITWISPSITTVLGWDPQDMLGHAVREFIHPDDFPTVVPAGDQWFAGKPAATSSEGQVVRLQTKAGGWCWVSNLASPVLDEQGRPAGIVGSMTVVDELVAARTFAQEQQLRLQAVLDGMVDPFMLLHPVRDSTGRVTDFQYADANPAALRLHGLTRDAFVGQRFTALHPAAISSGLFEMYVAVVDENKSLILDDWAYPADVLGGKTRFWDLRAVKVGDAVSQVSRDVTERHQIAARIAQSRQELELLLNNSGDIVFRANMQGTVEYVSPALTDVLGWTPEQLLGKLAVDVLHPDDLPLLQAYGTDLAEGRPVSATVRLRTQAGTYRWIATVLRPLRDSSGTLIGRSGSCRDVTELVEAQQLLSDSERRYRLLAENSSDVILLEHDHGMQWVSPSLTGALGWDQGDWLGHRFEEFVHNDDAATVANGRATVECGNSSVFVLRVRAKRGTFHWIEVHAGPFTDERGRSVAIHASFRLVDAEVAARQALEHLAHFDTLTGLLNRAEALDMLAAVAGSGRSPGHATAVLFCDVDEFKTINDTHGHAAGDDVLHTLAERVKLAIRRDDAAARMGGDELLVVLTGIHSMEEAVAVAEKIRQSAAAPITVEAGSISTTMSIGVTLMSPGESADDIVARADEAMYAAKRSGRNRVVAVAG